MFPQRFWMALGSGEALNEKITAAKWPAKAIRNERLLECYNIINHLLKGESVTHYLHVTIEDAKLYTLPIHRPLLLGAAVTNETARWMGEWAEGLLTVHKPINELKELINAFNEGGGKGKLLYLKVQLSFAKDDDTAIDNAFDQWRTNIFQGTVLGDLWKVEHFDAIGEFVKIDDLKKNVHVSSDVSQHIDWIKQYVDLGFETIILHNVSRNQEEFIKEFGEKVLPKL